MNVACVPPQLYAAGPGDDPALCGPTWRWPPSSIQTNEPPPAPIVWMYSNGMASGRPSNMASCRRTDSPSTMSEASRLVPPMSMVMRLPSPVVRANDVAPITPPAGPERMRFTGASRALSTVIAPPPERIMKKWPPKPFSASAFLSRPR